MVLAVLLGLGAVMPHDHLVIASAATFRDAEAAINVSLGEFITIHGATLDLIKNNALMYAAALRIGLEQAVLPFTWGFAFTETHRQGWLIVIFAATVIFGIRRQFGLAIFSSSCSG